ncbi:MAG: 30S ribosome-binding factor RbfA [Planctomycetota bacterium]
MERIGALIRKLVAEAIQHRLADPRIPPITSITRVEVAPDLAVARIHVSVMAPEPQRRLALEALRSAAGLLRRMLGPELRIRKVPLLDFRLDDSVRQSLDTVAVIDQAMRELGEPPEWERETAEPPEAAETLEDAAEGRDTPQEDA